MSRRWRRLGVAATVLVLPVIALAVMAAVEPVHDGALSDHFDGKRFFNIPAEATINKSVFELMRWRLTRQPEPWSHQRDIVYFTPPDRVDEGLRASFVNHATVLIQTAGKNILTDPVWSERTSPVGWAGPVRYRDAGIRFDNLPPIDAVLISHNHYDHLDVHSIRRLVDVHDPVFFVPLGNTRYLEDAGAARVIELDWWEGTDIDGLGIHAVPAQHWSRRRLFDENRALWAGFIIAADAGPVYFAGDTGMGPHFTEIAAVFGPPRLALLPVGAYRPRWFMKMQHIDPAEAVSAHVLLGATESMAIHFGTFQLGDDGQEEPVDDLREALLNADVDPERFWIPGNGDSRFYEAADETLARIAAR